MALFIVHAAGLRRSGQVTMRRAKKLRIASVVTWACATTGGCIYPLFPRTPIYERDVTGSDSPSAVTDGAVPSDGAGSDAFADGSVSMFPFYNDCREADFVDRSAPTADRTVVFGGEQGSPEFDYVPKCIVIAPGQSVHFVGDLLEHSLWPGTGPSDTQAGSPNNPIRPTTQGREITFPFPNAGFYPYYCDIHIANGMAGVVWVR